jgi:hypothetical protein
VQAVKFTHVLHSVWGIATYKVGPVSRFCEEWVQEVQYGPKQPIKSRLHIVRAMDSESEVDP